MRCGRRDRSSDRLIRTTRKHPAAAASCAAHTVRTPLVASGLLVLAVGTNALQGDLPLLMTSVAFQLSPFKIGFSGTALSRPFLQPTSLNRVSTSRHNLHCAASVTARDTPPSPVPLDSVVAELRKRILDAPDALPKNEEAQQDAERFLQRETHRFEMDSEGNILGGVDQGRQLAEELARETAVVVRVICPVGGQSLVKLGSAAEALLGETRTTEEKESAFGIMREHDCGGVAGYAGGENYGDDQFLETRGRGGDVIVPVLDKEKSSCVNAGRRILSKITSGVLRAVVRWKLPGLDPADFLELVDDGEGEGQVGSSGSDGFALGRLSSTPLRMCRYAGKDGVAFGAHTDTTFLTVIPCASAPGLEILQPTTGKWIRPEAAGDTMPGADVMLLAGELLQVLGQGEYQAAVHRVVRPLGLQEPRVSTPLLVRGIPHVAVHDTMLPASLSVGAATGARVLPTDGAEDTATATELSQGITMRDLWEALQFRAAPSDDTPLARSHVGWEKELRRDFAPFAPKGLSVLSVDPLLVRLNGFASPAMCEEIIALGAGSMSESKTWGGADSQDESIGVRKSSTTWVADSSLPLLDGLTARVSALSGLPPTFMEKWQVARYKPQGFFNLHTDHVPSFNNLICGGRLGTLILYLNDGFSGGHTEFPKLGVSVEPAAGDAIYFHSVLLPVEREDAYGMKVDERSAHAGLPVQDGEKWIATKWIHPLPYPNGKQGPETRRQAGWDEAGPVRAEDGAP